MRRWWSDRKKHQDEQALAAKAEARAAIRLLMECGDEEGYVALVKKLKPGIKPDELVAAIQQFREYRRMAARGGQIPS